MCPLNETKLVVSSAKEERKNIERVNKSEGDAIDGVNNNVQNQAEDEEVIETLKSNQEY